MTTKSSLEVMRPLVFFIKVTYLLHAGEGLPEVALLLDELRVRRAMREVLELNSI